jgi:hypothetical protein
MSPIPALYVRFVSPPTIFENFVRESAWIEEAPDHASSPLSENGFSGSRYGEQKAKLWSGSVYVCTLKFSIFRVTEAGWSSSAQAQKERHRKVHDWFKINSYDALGVGSLGYNF